jgi:hypothetical protein
MASHRTQISRIILDQLARGEMRLLVLVVAVRKRLGRYESIKGDLSEMVQGALRQLIAAKAVVDVEGVYALAKRA